MGKYPDDTCVYKSLGEIEKASLDVMNTRSFQFDCCYDVTSRSAGDGWHAGWMIDLVFMTVYCMI